MSVVERRYLGDPARPIHVRMVGERAAPAVVLLHQTPSSSAMYAAMMERLALARTPLRVLAPDTPGFGQSPAPVGAITVAGWADALDAALEQLGVVDAIVFGHHTGASLAAELAATRPTRVRRLILSGPPLLDPARRAALAATPPVEPVADGEHLRALWRRLRAKDPAAPLAVIDREVALAAGSLASWHLAYHAVAAHPLADRLDGLVCPTVVVAGGADSLRDPAIAAAARIRGARLVELAGAGSYACDTHAEALAALIEEAA